MELTADTLVASKFRLVRELGRGGMGAVWLAHHQELDIPCAIKFIGGDALTVPEVRERFTREAKAAARLRSPHVVQLLDHGVWEGVPYIAMELLDGEDVGKRLRRVGRIAPRECVVMLSQVARALTKAHQAGIVHRDLKPDNIYLVRDDDRDFVKILDFGIAKMNHQGLGATGGSTRTGAVLGTPYYMSPEQARGNKAVDFRSDLWSLAVIAFECLTGRLPFESDALGDLLLQVVVEPIPSIVAAAPDLPAALEGWWQRASARDPSLRFQSAKELVSALADALGAPIAGDQLGRTPENGELTGPVRDFASANGLGPTTAGRSVSPLVRSGTTQAGPAVRSRWGRNGLVVAGVLVAATGGAMIASRSGTASPSTAAPAQIAPVVTVSATIPEVAPATVSSPLDAPPAPPSPSAAASARRPRPALRPVGSGRAPTPSADETGF